MSHNTGTVQVLAPHIEIGPDSGNPATIGNTWVHNFVHTPAPSGTKFVMLFFEAVNIPAGNRLEVDLGYATDIFDSSSSTSFWTRPINHSEFPGGIPIRYIADGSLNGSVELSEYGRGESLAGEPGHPSISNSDPFILSGSYTEPTYDPFWFCNNPPAWENVACIMPLADIRRQVSQSCGMIVTVHGHDGDKGLSTCSVTLIGPDTIITAGHCLSAPEEALTSSVTFDYQTDCAGNVDGSYNPVFHKVTRVLKYRWNDGSGMDYAILQIAIPPAGLGIPVIPMRASLPLIGEQIFGIHQPNGAVKKISPPHGVSETVNSASVSGVGVDIDVSGGSSGSGLFDMMGRYVGVLSFGTSCNLSYFPSPSILADIAATPAPAPDQDVMLVIDRSGSMSGDAGTGQSKMDEAKDSASLFIQLVEANVGHRAGLVSFSSTAIIDEGIGNLNAGKKNQLIGPAPYSAGAVGNLTPSGWTSIGDGIDKAQSELAGGSNAKTILLLTDGLENTPPMIETAAHDIGDTTVHVIGLGTEANLNGGLLSNLAQSTGGTYTRAGDGLDLKKFFALAFGDIFEAGTLTDPTFELPRDQRQTKSMEFAVCDEEKITIIVGWDKKEAHLNIVLKAPNGDIITASSAGTESSSGHTWSFLKVPLPFVGEREGIWSVEFHRPSGGGEFPPPAPSLRYFMNVIASGGPLITPIKSKKRFYTGDSIKPLVRLAYPSGQDLPHSSVKLSVLKPNQAVGNILSNTKLEPPTEINGDIIPAAHSTLIKLEQQQSEPLFDYQEQWFDLHRDHKLLGHFEANGPWGIELDDLLSVPGNYSFRAVGQYGHQCKGSRETSWSISVAVAIDADATNQSVSLSEVAPGKVSLTFIPQDRLGHVVGPAALGEFTVDGVTGSRLVEPVKDNGDGSYTVVIELEPGSELPPGIIVSQPDRPSTTLGPCQHNKTEAFTPFWLWIIIVILVLIILTLLFF